MGVTEQVAELITGFRLEVASERSIAVAKQNILDNVAVSFAGLELDSGRIIVSYVKEHGGKPEAGVIASGVRTSVEHATLANGVLAFGQVWDDYRTAIIGHPSSTLVPAILPLADRGDCSGREVLRAYLVGFQLLVRLGRALNPAMYDQGWHTTGVMGSLGATAAAGSLLGLTSGQMAMALGIATSLACAIRQNIGTMTLALHAASAARNGVIAALLAEKGFSSDPNAIEGSMGFANVFTASGKYDLSRLTAPWVEPLEVINPGSGLKLYPSGGPSHAGIDAMLDIAINENVRPEEVSEVVWAGPTLIKKMMIRTDPQTGVEGKTGLEFCLAAALVDREVTLRQFTDQKVKDPLIREIMGKVRVTVHPEFANDVANFGTELTVRLVDGTEHRRTVRWPRGNPENRLSRDQLLGKFRQCADLVLTPAARERSIELLEGLDRLDAAGIRELYRTICLLED